MYQEFMLDDTYSNLEPFLDQESLKVHYRIYLKNLETLNQLLKLANYNYHYSLKDLMDHINIFHLSIRGEILYHLSSILNHNLYFYNISNQHHNQPTGTIKKDIDKYFQNYENFKDEFKKSAKNLKGSGYTFLVMDENKKLKIINTSNEDSPYSYGFIPVIALDLWEHAYFLKYKDKRDEYINNFFEVIDFDKVNQYYEKL